MTPELAQSLAAIRLRQTAELLTWMAGTVADPSRLISARDHVAEALVVLTTDVGDGVAW